MKDYCRGLRKGIPIALGYLSVSFTFGIKAVNGGIPALAAVLISLVNLTSAGQFAGTNLILECAGIWEMAITAFVVNARYMLMSLAMSQKIRKDTPILHRMLMGFGITDEIFAVASAETGPVTPAYFYGLMSLPIVGWTGGTLLGAVASDLMPSVLSHAMELGLYAMFLAIIIPPAKRNRAVLIVILLSVAFSVLLCYVRLFSFLSAGLCVILASSGAAFAGAILFPVKGGEDVSSD